MEAGKAVHYDYNCWVASWVIEGEIKIGNRRRNNWKGFVAEVRGEKKCLVVIRR